MSTVRNRAIINRPVADVFAYMDDLEREHKWQPYLVRCEKSTEVNGVGTVRSYENLYMGRRFTNSYEITEYELMFAAYLQ